MLFNELNSCIIFTFKLFCIYIAVVTGFGAIACSGSNLAYGAFSLLVFVDMTAVYGFVYEKAFAIPNGIQEIKANMIVQVHRPGIFCKRARRELVQRIKAVPPLGIQVGNFHTMERTSTPVFVDFVVTNLAGLLLLFR